MPTGKIIGYLPGWYAPPPATELASAGYTHILIAFGVFSTINPGQIVSAFSEISPEYIALLKSLGLKVLLSIGGASSSIPDTTVDFNKVLSLAPDFNSFQTNFVNSFQELVISHGFEGIDIDIEHDFNDPTKPLNSGTSFLNPKGDIEVLINCLYDLKKINPDILITLAPQAANISPTPAFNQTWGNYSSIIMKTSSILEWVGIQLYNTGGMYGIDQKIYTASATTSRIATSPDFSVAMTVDLLENWPSQITGRPTGWLPYVSNLKPDQIALGYPVPDNLGVSDGSPSASIQIISRAIKCLQTGSLGTDSGDTYKPPRAYPTFGAAFCWDISRDQKNNYAFATGLKSILNPDLPTPTPTPTSIKLGILITNVESNDFVLQPNLLTVNRKTY